jgi:hypothetical protein
LSVGFWCVSVSAWPRGGAAHWHPKWRTPADSFRLMKFLKVNISSISFSFKSKTSFKALDSGLKARFNRKDTEEGDP